MRTLTLHNGSGPCLFLPDTVEHEAIDTKGRRRNVLGGIKTCRSKELEI